MVNPQASRFWRAALQSELVDAGALQACWEAIPPEKRVAEHLDRRLARQAIQANLLTLWQAQQLLAGRSTGYLIDRYVLLDLIGQGGMGRVFRARDTRLNRQVALKLLSPERVKIPRAVTRFQREARVGAQLQHENLVRIYDEGSSNGKCYLVMEYIEGKNIGELIAEGGTVPPAIAAGLARQVALGLQHAQQKGLIHRDVNPCNILVTRDGTAKLTDLGLAIDLADQAQVTRDGATVGTFDYISPEQARHSHAVDSRSDIYSLGCTLYHMIAGRVPFPAPSLMEKLFAHQTLDPEPLDRVVPGVPPGLSEVVLKMMKKKPDERYPTPLAVAQALEPFVHGRSSALDGEAPVNGAGPGGFGTPGSRTKITEPPLAPPETPPPPALPPADVPPIPALPAAAASAMPALPAPIFSQGPAEFAEVVRAEFLEEAPAVAVAARPETSDDELLRNVLPLDFGPRTPSQDIATGEAGEGGLLGLGPDLDLRQALGLAGAAIAIAVLGAILLLKIFPGASAGTPRPTRASGGGPAPRVAPAPKGPPSPITVVAADGATVRHKDLFEAMRRAIGSRGYVELRGDANAPIRLTASQANSLSGGKLAIRAAEGEHPVLEVEIQGPGAPLLQTASSDTPLTLSGVTIIARYTGTWDEATEPPALIQASSGVTMERCTFRASGGPRGIRAVATEGGDLTVTGCWFEGFARALDQEAYPGSSATIKQSMFVQTGPEAESTGWAVRVRCTEGSDNRVRKITLGRCTVRGHGLLELVGFGAPSDYQVEIVDSAVRADALLAWRPGTGGPPLSDKVVHWTGRGNLYDVRGEAWVVSGPETSGAPAPPKDLQGWMAFAKEVGPVRDQIRFRIDTASAPGGAGPEDFALTNLEGATVGADPESVGP